MSFKAFLKRLYEEYENDAVADSAAALAYYFVFSLFPFLFFLATLTAYVPYVRQLGRHDPGARARDPARAGGGADRDAPARAGGDSRARTC